jgi:hypothetical protein
MKGIQGLIVAVVLGLCGAAANFYYLNTEAQKRDMVAFIGIKKGAKIAPGERLTADNLVKVEIPANHVGNLKDYACQWDEYNYIKEDKRAWRLLDSSMTEGGLLLLRGDYREPPKQLELGRGERAECIPTPKNFVTAHVNPGDRIMFRVAALTPPGPTPAAKPPAATPAASSSELQPKPDEAEVMLPAAEAGEPIGPFVVLSIGNRLGTVEVQKAAKIAPVQENVLLIRVSKNVAGEEDRFNKLWSRIHAAGPNSYDITLLGRE